MREAAGWERIILIRPALLKGRRVDFWAIEDWQPVASERPRGGYWFQRETGRLLVALDGQQSLRAAAEARRLAKRLGLSLRDAKAAEAGRAMPWTSCLTPVPARIAEDRIRLLAHQTGFCRQDLD